MSPFLADQLKQKQTNNSQTDLARRFVVGPEKRPFTPHGIFDR
jgi:hypothetical protein